MSVRIERGTLSSSSGDLDRPVRSARSEWSARRGVLLRLESAGGDEGVGEASPLPGYSRDDLETCGAALTDFCRRLPLEVPESALFSHRAFFQATGLGPAVPAARHAVETAVLDLAARRANVPVWRLLAGGDRAVSPVPLSVLLPGGDHALALEAAEAAVSGGIGTLKIKVGSPAAFEDECLLVAALRERFRGEIRLRLDANQSFTRGEASGRLARLAAFAPELIEEPVPARELPQLRGSPFPVALDESLESVDDLERFAAAWARDVPVGAVVLKPMVLGGLLRCIDLARGAGALGLEVTVSHTFDGPAARVAAGHLALATASRTLASGLGSHAGLAAWPSLSNPLFDGPSLIPADVPGLGIPATWMRAVP